MICVPLIPIVIALIQTIAKKILSKYWGQYTALGDSFLENLQGLTTLKIYQSDEYKHMKMNEEAEKFRKVTMKVLTMQLNSIAVMDLVAFGGAALGIIISISELNNGNINFFGCFAIIMLSAEFFIPMRQLGSYFHITMNGMAASKKIFKILDLEQPIKGDKTISSDDITIEFKNAAFSYNPERQILNNVNAKFQRGKVVAIVGESGCGKSTMASILMGRNNISSGNVFVNGVELKNISEESLMSNITLISNNSYIFLRNSS